MTQTNSPAVSDDVKALVERLRVAAAWLQDRGAEELMLETADMLLSLQRRAKAAEARVAELERDGWQLVPKLLEALHLAEATMSIISPRNDKRRYLSVIEQLRTVIAKATASEGE